MQYLAFGEVEKSSESQKISYSHINTAEYNRKVMIIEQHIARVHVHQSAAFSSTLTKKNIITEKLCSVNESARN